MRCWNYYNIEQMRWIDSFSCSIEIMRKYYFCITLMKQFFLNNWGLKFGIAISFAYCGPKDLIAQDPLPIIITHYHALFTINHIIKKNFTRKQSNQYYLALFICLNLSITDQWNIGYLPSDSIFQREYKLQLLYEA